MTNMFECWSGRPLLSEGFGRSLWWHEDWLLMWLLIFYNFLYFQSRFLFVFCVKHHVDESCSTNRDRLIETADPFTHLFKAGLWGFCVLCKINSPTKTWRKPFTLTLLEVFLFFFPYDQLEKSLSFHVCFSCFFLFSCFQTSTDFF